MAMVSQIEPKNIEKVLSDWILDSNHELNQH